MIKAPIIVTEDGDLWISSSVERAELDLEPADVNNDVYVAYDSEGHLLHLSVSTAQSERRFLFLKWMEQDERVVIREEEPALNRSSELHQKLVNYLLGRDVQKQSLSESSLEEFIAIASKHQA